MTQSQGFFQFQSPCHQCGGAGRSGERCSPCNGKGTIPKNKEVEVNIPAGVDNDSNVRLRDQGDAGRGGGPRGHLFILIKVNSHPRFRREGLDIHCEVPIPMTMAVTGGKVTVPTLDKEVILTVRPGTQPETVSRMRGKGVAKVGNSRLKGDIILKYKVNIPRDLSDRAKELLDELAVELGDKESESGSKKDSEEESDEESVLGRLFGKKH